MASAPSPCPPPGPLPSVLHIVQETPAFREHLVRSPPRTWPSLPSRSLRGFIRTLGSCGPRLHPTLWTPRSHSSPALSIHSLLSECLSLCPWGLIFLSPKHFLEEDVSVQPQLLSPGASSASWQVTPGTVMTAVTLAWDCKHLEGRKP